MYTLIFTFVLCYLAGLGLTAGAHRLWSHRSYKAKWPFRLLLAFFDTIAFDDSLYEYAKLHRIHHKYSETNADPHNYNEGFFFSHFGWKMMNRHPEFTEKLSKLDLSDVMQDPIARIQRKFWLPLAIICCFVLPTLVPYFCWNEDLITAFCISGTLRWCITSHAKATVNSFAHRWGQKPYDKNPGHACENKLVVWLAFGEGFHNFHHTFPWDYKQSELGWKYNMNLSAALVEVGALLGQTYDLKVAAPELIRQRRERTGEPLPEDYDYPSKRSFAEWIIVIILFIAPLLLWIASRYAFGHLYAYLNVFNVAPDKNIHNLIIDNLHEEIPTYWLVLKHELNIA
ncbi:stearoyl-CoA desaturase 5-like protein [Dinothrombium tinctorium]|uniref:Stearoyl-CoA desaturase 5-like protein n=1 Tax=Dinothrombium tinctorium TaxID=1965070 RepID=A0A3S3SBC1_9ACAR|nr:stearoyl-CoA desaturase 5-like protein [Dinothrombium tinctorium]RWS11423.1 stearoyl-CoA desaturase 5-like protein [Dinothrombium tinctorium]RWS11781.1 stearoyl-CoA desaturase 5-like protein [Dinothrombium tinctorium]